MFYKKENENWIVGSIVRLPSGEVLNAENKENDYGWVWYDEEPEEYITWKESQNKDYGFFYK